MSTRHGSWYCERCKEQHLSNCPIQQFSAPPVAMSKDKTNWLKELLNNMKGE